MQTEFNEHNKAEYPPSHTAEHLLNQLMHRTFGCERSTNAHIERKKSKISFQLATCPSEEEIKDIESEMNRLIEMDMPVVYEIVDKTNLPEAMLSRLPDDASQNVRLVRIGDFDVCPCIGMHVESTSKIGQFKLLGTNWTPEQNSFRIRFKIVEKE